MSKKTEQLLRDDAAHLWHPYASAIETPVMFPVSRAEGVRIELADGRQLIDGMASWWSAIHGYNHPVLNRAVKKQLSQMSHVMFGGLTHKPAVKLGRMLCELTPEPLSRVFFSDSGSVAVEVALKMALQYWQAKGEKKKKRFIALKNGYHGDTFGAMSVCDPVNGMHHLFAKAMPQQLFAPAPSCGFEDKVKEKHLDDMADLLAAHHQEVAAVIVEPVVQGAGGMRFYAPEYLTRLRALCDAFGVLLIFDEIATGFGRTGKLFALEHTGISPDILCLGKAITGGYMTLAATLCSDDIATTISKGEAGVFMHGPTFMANPLACSVACASLELLLSQPWQRRVKQINKALNNGLAPAKNLDMVADVRTLGAIGVIEMQTPVDMNALQPLIVEQGIWVRPFGKLIYCMPPYVINDDDVASLCAGMVKAAEFANH